MALRSATSSCVKGWPGRETVAGIRGADRGEDELTKFCALTPKQALEVITAAGVEDAAKLIRDHAAAGLVKSYADMQLTIDARGKRSSVRGGAVAPVVWERIARDGVSDDVWGGGTVRLAGSDLLGGEPTIHVTGVAFRPDDIKRLAGQQRPGQPTRPRPQAIPAGGLEAVEQTPATTQARRAPDLSALHSGALHLTVEQTKAALSIGHTTVYKLLKAGDLKRAPSKAGTRITAESVRRYAGLTS